MTPKNRDAALVEYQRQIGKVLNCVANCWVYAYPSRKAGQYMLIAAPADAEKTDKASEYFLRVKRGKEVLFFRGINSSRSSTMTRSVFRRSSIIIQFGPSKVSS